MRLLGPVTFETGLFYVSFAICAFTTLMVRTTYDSVFGMPKDAFEPFAYAISALLLVLKILREREPSVRFAGAILLLVVGTLSFWFAGSWRFSALFFFIAAGKDVSLRWLAAIALVVQGAVLAVTLPLALAGKLYSFTVWREVDGTWMPRSSYGYGHPNFLGEVFLVIALAYAALRFPRFKVPDALVYAALALAAALLVWSRTATACIVLAAALALASTRIVRSRARQKTAAVLALVMLCALGGFSLTMMVVYDPEVPWMAAADQALSTRLSLANRFYEVFPPTPFGRTVMAVRLEDFVQEMPDNAYVMALVKQGIVPALCLLALVLATYLSAVRHARWDACILGLAVYSVGSIMEMYAVNFTLDFFLIGAAFTWYACWPDSTGTPRKQVGT